MPQPLNKYILIQPTVEDKKTASGILVPNIDFELLSKGMVKATWPAGKNEHGQTMESQVSVGNEVLFLYKEKEKRLTTQINGVEYYYVPESEIVAII